MMNRVGQTIETKSDGLRRSAFSDVCYSSDDRDIALLRDPPGRLLFTTAVVVRF